MTWLLLLGGCCIDVHYTYSGVFTLSGVPTDARELEVWAWAADEEPGGCVFDEQGPQCSGGWRSEGALGEAELVLFDAAPELEGSYQLEVFGDGVELYAGEFEFIDDLVPDRGVCPGPSEGEIHAEVAL